MAHFTHYPTQAQHSVPQAADAPDLVYDCCWCRRDAGEPVLIGRPARLCTPHFRRLLQILDDSAKAAARMRAELQES